MLDLQSPLLCSTGLVLALLAILGLLVLFAVGCSDQITFPTKEVPKAKLFPNERTAGPCHPVDSSERHAPAFHTVDIDGNKDFGTMMERTSAGRSSAYKAFATWDGCRLFLGYSGPVLGEDQCPPKGPCPPARRGASPYRVVSFYLDTDPLENDGSTHPRRTGQRMHHLPFNANYLIEVRTDGRMVRTEQGKRVYKGNAQVYKNVDEWSAGLTGGWEPKGRHSLNVAQAPEHHYLELSIDRSALGHPCAVEVLAWVTDTRRGVRFGHWPSPDSARSTPDSVALNYYGFPLVEHMRPMVSSNLNRIDYSAAGTDCAQGGEDHQ